MREPDLREIERRLAEAVRAGTLTAEHVVDLGRLIAEVRRLQRDLARAETTLRRYDG